MIGTLRWDRDAHDWPMREASRFVDVDGLRWHVQELGAGPTLLLLHGTGSSTHSWRGMAPLLAPYLHIVAPDLPGHGFSGPLPPARQSLRGMGDAMHALLQTLRVKPAAVLGHSAGAALMLRMALDGHLDATHLIGLNAALLPFEGLAGVMYPAMARLLATHPFVPRLAAWRARDRAAVRRLIAATGSQLDDRGVDLYARLMRSPGHIAGVLSMMARWDLDALWRDLPALRPQLLLLVGERDATVPPRQAGRTAERIAQCRVQRLPGLGHLAHEEAPQRVADAVRAALDPAYPARAAPDDASDPA